MRHGFVASAACVATLALVDVAVTKSLCPVEVLCLLLNREDRLRNASSDCSTAQPLGGLGSSPVHSVASTGRSEHLSVVDRGADTSNLFLLPLVSLELLLTQLLKDCSLSRDVDVGVALLDGVNLLKAINFLREQVGVFALDEQPLGEAVSSLFA